MDEAGRRRVLGRESGPDQPPAGAPRRPRPCPGPTCAPSTAPSSPHQTSRPSRLVARRSPSRPARSAARSGLARWETQSVDVQVARRLDDQVLQPAQGAGGGAHPLEVGDPPVVDPQQRLDRQGTAEQRRGGADPSATPEVLQRVDVEQRGRQRRPGCAAAAAASSTEPPASRTSAALSAAYPVATPTCRESTTVTGTGASPRGQQGRLVACRSCRRTGGSTGPRRRRRPPPSRRPRAGRPERAATC